MKIKYLSFCLFIFTLSNISSAIAQNYTFPIENGTWVNRLRTYTHDGSPGSVVYTTEWIDEFSSSGVDTIINSETYEKFDFTNSSGSSYHGGMRHDSGKVFFVPADSTNEYLLYDFTIGIGDSAYVLTQTGSEYPTSGSVPNYEITIETPQMIDSVIVNGTYRRRLYMWSGSTWIEGIGNLSGLFMPTNQNISNYQIDLACMSVNDTIEVNNALPNEVGISGSCDFTVGIKPTIVNSIQIYPNPASGDIVVDLSGLDFTENIITVYDALERKVYSEATNSFISKIPTNNWGQKGVYYLNITGPDNRLIKMEKIVLNH